MKKQYQREKIFSFHNKFADLAGFIAFDDKDEEILSWAFNKERNKGDVEIFTTGNGDYIVVYVNGKQDAGIADPESVREQIEPIVKNKLLAKKIIEKINNAKANSLDAVAKLFGTTKQNAQVIFSRQW